MSIRIKHDGKTIDAADGKDAAKVIQVALDLDWYRANVQAAPAGAVVSGGGAK